MTTLVISIHIIVCITLVLLVLLQHGKGADMGATFGGSSQTVFGTDGPVPLLNKITTAAAVIFMVTSIVLAYNSAHSTSSSVMQSVDTKAIEFNKKPVEPVIPATEPTPENKGATNFPLEDAAPSNTK